MRRLNRGFRRVDVRSGSWRFYALGIILAFSLRCVANEQAPEAGSQPQSTGVKAGNGAGGGLVPDWAPHAIFYQIFPERFANGDRSNDPTHESLEFPEVTPKNWRVSRWDGDWYARDGWEIEAGSSFYDNGVFNRRYGGDLQGVIDNLDYLQELGINTIYLNPVFYARSLHKYDGNSFHHVDPHFGPDPEGDFEIMSRETSDTSTWQWTAADKQFLDLIEQAKSRDIRIIIDGVFNHCGRDFFAFKNLREKQRESDYVSWFDVKSYDDPTTEANEFKYECWWGVETLPCFAETSDPADLHPGPKKYVFDSTARWMDPNGDGDPSDGIDGWRLDVANELPNKFWVDWHEHVRSLNPQAYTVAEIWTDARKYLQETGFTATMNYHGFAFPMKGFFIDGKMTSEEFAKELQTRRDPYPAMMQFAMQNLVDSHDTDRVASMIVNADPAIVGTERKFLQPDRFDYDVGERVSPRQYRDYDVSKPNESHRAIQRLVALFQMTYVGAPMIYYGTESGMWGGDDPDNRQPMIFRDSVARPTRARPDGTTVASPDTASFDTELFEFYRDIIQLRKDHAALRTGDFRVISTGNSPQAFAFERSDDSDRLFVVFNRGPNLATVSYDLPEGSSGVEEVFSTPGAPARITRSRDGSSVTIRQTPLTGAVFRVVP